MESDRPGFVSGSVTFHLCDLSHYLPSKLYFLHLQQNKYLALADVAQWIEHPPANQKVTFNYWSGYLSGLQAQSPAGGGVRGNQLMFLLHIMFLSLFFSFLSPLSKKK